MTHNNQQIPVNYQHFLDFWYSDAMSPYWFNSTKEIDDQMRQQYLSLWESAADGQLDSWGNQAEGALALIIILDQLPLNMFRNEAKSFSTEQKAVSICKRAINNGLDKMIDENKLAFFYMPLMHSENIDDQNLSLKLFREAGLGDNAKFAEHHLSIVKKFGRFPHRNKILGRDSTEEEKQYLKSDQAFKG